MRRARKSGALTAASSLRMTVGRIISSSRKAGY
jgi:hypothetical protein